MKFASRKLPSPAAQKYRALVQRHPFVLFGLPFVTIIVAGSFFLTPATALRYEKHDKKRKWLSKEEALASSGLTKRKVDPREEYYRLAAKDLDNWEQRRVKRLPGEPDGLL